MSWPRYRMRPDEVGNMPAIILPVVVLPHPDSPTRHNTSPAEMVRLTSSTALMVCPLTMKVRITCSRVISGSDTRFIVCNIWWALTRRLIGLQCFTRVCPMPASLLMPGLYFGQFRFFLTRALIGQGTTWVKLTAGRQLDGLGRRARDGDEGRSVAGEG